MRVQPRTQPGTGERIGVGVPGKGVALRRGKLECGLNHAHSRTRFGEGNGPTRARRVERSDGGHCAGRRRKGGRQGKRASKLSIRSSSTKSRTPSLHSEYHHLTLDLFCHAQVRRLYDQYSFSVIPLLGTILAGDRESYQYLVESIRRFPSQRDFAQMITDAGFATGGFFEGDGGAWRDLWGGISCIHMGIKV